jgi:ATP-dependent helicase/nuclease subunit B
VTSAERPVVVCGTAGVVPQLAAAITAAQQGDSLAPVDVVVPTGVAGVTLRRAAAGTHGWANVRFASLPQLAERLSARFLALQPDGLRRPLAPGDRAKAVQQVVMTAPGDGPLLRAARRQRATAGLLEAVFSELEAAEVDPSVAMSRLAGLSSRAAEVLELYRLYREQVTGLLSPTELLAVAAQAVEAEAAPDTHVVLLAAGSFTNAEKRLLSVLRQAERLSVVLPPTHTADTAHWLEAGKQPQPEPVAARLVVAPDADEEVRLAVRTLLAHLSVSGCRPERVGVAYISATPYARALAEQLRVAGVPHHVPSQRTLAQTVAGRTVRGLLALHLRDFPRPDVLRWMADGPLLDRNGKALRAVSWERVSRDAGVSRGFDTWQVRLTRYAEGQRERALDQPERAVSCERQAVRALALLAEVEELHALTDTVLSARSWAEVADRLISLLRRTLGGRRDVDRWAGSAVDDAADIRLEQDAYEVVLTLLQSLAGRPGPLSTGAVIDALDDGLAASVTSGTTLGRGVLVGSLRSFAGADLDLLLILGCTEDALPARRRESTVLRDADRAQLSPQLATVASRRADEQHRWRSALHAASSVHLSYPRVDSRAQRRQFASPLFLEQARRLVRRKGGDTVSAAAIDEGAIQAPWFAFYPSFDASARRATTFGSTHELDVALSLEGHVDALAAADGRFARGLAAARARAAGSFGDWSGRTGPLPSPLREKVDAHLSASTLQQWATCPASHLFGEVLGFRDLEDRAGEDTIDARDKGTLVHGVFEALLRPHLRTDAAPGISPDTAWSPDDIAEALRLLDADAAALAAHGLTGREVLWTAQLARLRRSVVRVLAHDSVLRRERRSTPVAVEAAFGRNGVENLVVELPTQGAVSFAGYVDRIDLTETGGLVVVDYKTGQGYGYDAIPKHTKPDPDADLVDRGRKLQLLLYGLAARQLQGLPDADVQAWFWFVELGALHRGGPVTAAQEQRLEQVLDVVVGGIRDGVYPANPGNETWKRNSQTWENCSFCAFDLVCPTTRVEQWSLFRRDPQVQMYAELVDPTEAAP